jgi:hypothetical protein
MSQELLQLLERRRELDAAGEMVDMFLGKQLDSRLRRGLVRLTVERYKTEGASFADKLTTTKIRVALMERYGADWTNCAEWKSHKAAKGAAHG